MRVVASGDGVTADDNRQSADSDRADGANQAADITDRGYDAADHPGALGVFSTNSQAITGARLQDHGGGNHLLTRRHGCLAMAAGPFNAARSCGGLRPIICKPGSLQGWSDTGLPPGAEARVTPGGPRVAAAPRTRL